MAANIENIEGFGVTSAFFSTLTLSLASFESGIGEVLFFYGALLDFLFSSLLSLMLCKLSIKGLALAYYLPLSLLS